MNAPAAAARQSAAPVITALTSTAPKRAGATSLAEALAGTVADLLGNEKVGQPKKPQEQNGRGHSHSINPTAGDGDAGASPPRPAQDGTDATGKTGATLRVVSADNTGESQEMKISTEDKLQNGGYGDEDDGTAAPPSKKARLDNNTIKSSMSSDVADLASMQCSFGPANVVDASGSNNNGEEEENGKTAPLTASSNPASDWGDLNCGGSVSGSVASGSAPMISGTAAAVLALQSSFSSSPAFSPVRTGNGGGPSCAAVPSAGDGGGGPSSSGKRGGAPLVEGTAAALLRSAHAPSTPGEAPSATAGSSAPTSDSAAAGQGAGPTRQSARNVRSLYGTRQLQRTAQVRGAARGLAGRQDDDQNQQQSHQQQDQRRPAGFLVNGSSATSAPAPATRTLLSVDHGGGDNHAYSSLSTGPIHQSAVATAKGGGMSLLAAITSHAPPMEVPSHLSQVGAFVFFKRFVFGRWGIATHKKTKQ